MPFVADEDEASEHGAGFVAPDNEASLADRSVGAFASNLGSDVKNTAVGLGKTALAFGENPVGTAFRIGKSLPDFVKNEGTRVGAGELLTGHPKAAVEKAASAFYDKPLTTALDFAPVLGGLGKMAGVLGEGAGAAEIGADAAAEAGPTAEFIGDQSMGPGEPPEPLYNIKGDHPRAGSTVSRATLDKLGIKIPPAVEKVGAGIKDAAEAGYDKLAGTPGWAGTVAKYLREYAQNSSLKNMGASPAQFGKLGAEKAHALGEFGLEHGVTAPEVGSIGMGEKVGHINEAAGRQIGALRDLADKAGAPNLAEAKAAIRAKLDPVYLRGVESGQKGTYAKAMSELDRVEPTHSGLANLATKLNKAAAKNRLVQPTGAITDVANEISRYNNEAVRAKLGEKAGAYDAALHDFGATKKIQQFLGRKAAREGAGRMGPGGGVRHMMQNFLDSFGYKAQARIAKRLADVIEKNPAKAGNLSGLFDAFVDEVHDIGDDLGKGDSGE